MIYCAYSLIRGPIVHWRPYPFLDPDEAGGYLGLFAWIVDWASRRLRLSVA